MAKNKAKKQFVLNSKEQCIVYLYKIISSCELCMDDFREYNRQIESELKNLKKGDLVPIKIYKDFVNKTYNIMTYILNLLGDAQSASISYMKYRKLARKVIKNGDFELALSEIDDEVESLISEFNKTRNWLNHVPESLLVAEMELVESENANLHLDPIVICHNNYVTYDYFEHLYLSNDEFYTKARKIIQSAKKRLFTINWALCDL